MADEWEARLREKGFRITPQRQLVLEAVEGLRHGTPEQILVEVQRTASGVNLSTIYRTLEVLEDVGLVTHAHIGHGPPTYHAVDEHVHIHLVCDRCRKVMSIPASAATTFVQALEKEYGFHTDISHVSVHGQCDDCDGLPPAVESDDPL
ncbi:MAG: transcriptional repressor [Candidatus Nanopelagicales bacterium]|nr:transcriptional repressor [Candidatus Nanopelagicales bacterium]MCF8542379.1 transcriptional repressor [Candidatus Nanopelagicales bacterium]MCF8556484.1 transcriptional repressor [Candidatus Nanopelagicales bacterium]